MSSSAGERRETRGRVPTEGGWGKALACRAYRLASPEGRRLLHALFLLLEVDARLRLTGFARLLKALRLPPGALEHPSSEQRPGDRPRAARPRLRGGPDAMGAAPATLPETQFQEAQRMAQAIRRAARYVPRAHCLHRALALLAWLRRRGVAAELRMGVQSSGGRVEGHAWIEWRGIPVDEDRAIGDAFGLLEDCKVMHVRNSPPSG